MSDEKVVSLRGDTPNGEPVPAVVEVLETLLADANSGYLRAIAYATVRSDRTTAVSWTTGSTKDFPVSISFETHALGNAVATLAWKYAADT